MLVFFPYYSYTAIYIDSFKYFDLIFKFIGLIEVVVCDWGNAVDTFVKENTWHKMQALILNELIRFKASVWFYSATSAATFRLHMFDDLTCPAFLEILVKWSSDDVIKFISTYAV